ncbi:uncharacterized protein LOC124875827 isoform X2 [Girardinichthys multiradiatus]|uniref:uncharacterized protein LOC124875827 isoform X2 n=1 Tax=Girardinichthys multiradiatus TaxID=208333 RepID=UPI001FAB6634|nr:uncharacterized protein LOC124875827 isoform X2 [Girardinichthys multiradiatus]
MADPMLPAKVGENCLNYLVDTGATYSTITHQPPKPLLSTKTVSVMGFSGVAETLPVTVPLPVQIGTQRVTHPFVCSPSTPVNLLGRDLLVKLGASVLCGTDGLTVTFPDGSSLACGQMLQHGQYFLQPVEEEYVDIYWGLLTAPSSPSSIFSVYQLWKPWIQSLCLYTSPPDPPHVTLFYDPCHTEWYQDLFNETVEAKELGGVVKRSLAAGDWQDTSVTNLSRRC